VQVFINKNKNWLTLISGILIVIGLVAHHGFKNELLGIVTLTVAGIIGLVPVTIQAVQALRVKVVSIEFLVTIAVVGAFLIRNFEEAAIVTFLFLFGSYLEQRTLNKTRSAIKELTELAPESALILDEDGNFEEIEVDEVNKGDILLVKTGAKVPVDGYVTIGEGYIDEASITGEPFPVKKVAGDFVYAGTILDNGTIQIKADRVGEDTTFGRIIELVEEAQDSKSEAERFIDRFAKYYTPAVLIFAFLVWIVTKDVEMAITILVLGCPGALVIGVPVSNVSGIGNGARNNILLKGSEVTQQFSKVDTMIFDKTGTLTVGNPEVADQVIFYPDTQLALSYLASVERESDHPLARAITRNIGEVEFFPVESTNVVAGGGVIAIVDNKKIVVGNEKLLRQEAIAIDADAHNKIRRYENNGDSLVLMAIDGNLAVIMGIRDRIRPGVKEELKRLTRLKVKNLTILSGDNQGTVDRIASELGFTAAYGNLLPEDKAEHIKRLQEQGEIVAFVGDGVNDSPSLAVADIGIAMGGGTDVAIETSDIVLANSDFSKLSHALGLAKATVRNMRQNILVAIGTVFVLLAALFFSEWMNMTIGMFAHEASVLIVILNGMRLLRYKLKI
jgi:Cd2+/Zn2+-exporting ATPase